MDYTPYCPTDQDRQESHQPFVETNGCMPFAIVHCIEIQEKYIFGNETDYSEQALYQAAKVDPKVGSTITANLQALKSGGLVKISVSPEPVDFTLAEWLTPIDPQKMATGKDWLNQWDIETSSLAGDGKTIIPASVAVLYLTDFPPLITIDLNNNGPEGHQFHEVVLINDHQYFDSYSTLIKELTHPIYYVNKLKIRRKTMSNAEFVHKAGTKEYGWYLPKLSEEANKDMSLNLGINILNSDGTINYGAAKEVTGL